MPPMHPFMMAENSRRLSWKEQQKILPAFLAYYKKHKTLLVCVMAVAVISPAVSSVSPVIILKTLKEYLPAHNVQMLVLCTCAFLLLQLIDSLSGYLNMKWGKILGSRMETEMRHDFFEHLQTLSFSYFDQERTGTIMSKITNDLTTVATLAHRLPECILSGVLRFILGLGIMLWINWKLALFALLPAPLIILWLYFWQTKIRDCFMNVRKQIAALNVTINNGVEGIRETQSYGCEEKQLAVFDGNNRNLLSAQEKLSGKLAGFHTGMGLMLHGYTRLFIAIGILLACIGLADVSEIIVFFMYSHSISMPIMMLTDLFEQYQQGMTAFERFQELLRMPPEIQDPPEAEQVREIRSGEIEVRNVCFHYRNNRHAGGDILKDLSFRIPSGSKVAIVGESGAGKSTIASLLPRFYEPQSGSILIGGTDIRKYKLSALRAKIGTVSQNSFLFDTTLRDNIAFGSPEASVEQIEKAASFAGIHDFIQSLPQKYETLCGQNGVLLSGGQRQRISIARAFLKNPEILILDEATSALDNETETHIQQSIDKLSEDRTTIIIAHRLSTVQNADCILFLENGTITESGTHQELMALNGSYARLYNTKNCCA